MHKYLADAGVDGVKVDAQSGIGTFGSGQGGGAALTRAAVSAVESSVKAAFGRDKDLGSRSDGLTGVVGAAGRVPGGNPGMGRVGGSWVKKPFQALSRLNPLSYFLKRGRSVEVSKPQRVDDAAVALVGCMCHRCRLNCLG